MALDNRKVLFHKSIFHSIRFVSGFFEYELQKALSAGLLKLMAIPWQFEHLTI